MEWGNVTPGEVLSSLQDVDWKQPPHSPAELFAQFSLPQSRKELETRMKCNLYNYRVDYLLVGLAVVSLLFIGHPSSILALSFLLAGFICLNNTFAQTLSNSILKAIRQIHMPTAQKLRTISGGHSGLGAPGKTTYDIRIVGIPRKMLVPALMGLSLFLLFRKGMLLRLFVTFLIDAGLISLHASFRVPNLKTKLASAREEFRAVWRGYQADRDYLA